MTRNTGYEEGIDEGLPLEGDTELSKMVDNLILTRSLPIEDYFQMDDSSLEHKLITSVGTLTFEGKLRYASFLAKEIAGTKGITASGRAFAGLFGLFAETRDPRILFDLNMKLGLHKVDLNAKFSPMDVENFFTTVLISMIKVMSLAAYSNSSDLRKHELSREAASFMLRENVNEALAAHAEVIRMEYLRTFN
jgi:hypothetical protein